MNWATDSDLLSEEGGAILVLFWWRPDMQLKNPNKGWDEANIDQSWLWNYFARMEQYQSPWLSMGFISASFCDPLSFVHNSFYTCVFWNVLWISSYCRQHLGEPCSLHEDTVQSGWMRAQEEGWYVRSNGLHLSWEVASAGGFTN